MIDFLTYKTIQTPKGNDKEFIILNSTTMSKHAATLIQNDINLAHKQLILWFDNEEPGSKASESEVRATGYITALDCQVFSAKENYKDYNDLNAYWTATNQLFTAKFINLKPDSTPADLENLSL